MAQDLVVWTGPVASFQVPGATVPGAKEKFFNCFGDRDPFCHNIGDKLRVSTEKLAIEAKMPELGRVFFGAHSAGGSVLKRLLEEPEYRKLATAVLLSDATYTASWIDKEKQIPPPIEGFVLYALDALSDPAKLFVATASPIQNKVWASGVENLQAIRAEVERRSGKKFAKLDHFYGVDPGPDAAYQLGNIILAEYPLKPIGHAHTKIAPQVWQRILLPWLEHGPAPPPGPSEEPPSPPEAAPITSWLAGLLGVLTGLFAVRLLAKRKF